MPRTLGTAAVAVAAFVAAVGLPAAATPPDDERTIVHVLNRIGFGARPGDVEHVREIGIQAYVERQLNPDRLPDADMPRRLAHLRTIGLGADEISRHYEQPLLAARRARRQDATDGSERGTPQPPRGDVQQRASGLVVELAEHKLLRAIYSERQLQEVLTDFWFNHFNVDARKGRDRFLLTEYEREAIRPHVLGRFRSLLGATAHSPAMLFYLDNWLSADPGAGERRALAAGGHRARGRGREGFTMPAPQPPQPEGGTRRRGLNENYARELMELHTLGVDGGFTQTDVTEVARAFTGWTIRSPREGAAFRFEPRLHDNGEKTILGHRIEAGGGERDGEQVLDLLAAHPSTARFISTKLARRFVADTPPPALVDRLAGRFAATRGDLRAVMATLLTSPEFLAPESYRAKVKSPFEFVVGAARATGLRIGDARPLVRSLQDLGMPLYQCQPPTGYQDTADAWTNAGALVNRMNFALALASGGVGRAGAAAPGMPARGRPAGSAPAADVGSWQASIESALAHDLSDATRATIAKAATAAERVALALGSPEFQRR